MLNPTVPEEDEADKKSDDCSNDVGKVADGVLLLLPPALMLSRSTARMLDTNRIRLNLTILPKKLICYWSSLSKFYFFKDQKDQKF